MKTTRAVLSLLLLLFITGWATQREPQRYAWVTGLKPEKAAFTASFTPLPGPRWAKH